MRRSITPYRFLAAIAIAACIAPACADVFGLNELELQEPQDAASHADASDGPAESDVSIDGLNDGPRRGQGGHELRRKGRFRREDRRFRCDRGRAG